MATEVMYGEDITGEMSRIQGSTKLLKIRVASTCKAQGEATYGKFHTEDPQIVGATVQSLVARVTCVSAPVQSVPTLGVTHGIRVSIVIQKCLELRRGASNIGTRC